MINGIDVSDWQGHINWSLVATQPGLHFVFIKAAQGRTWVDPYLAQNIAGAREQHLQVGFYTYCEPSSGSGAEDAAHFAEVLNDYGGLQVGDLLAMDLEEDAVGAKADLAAYAIDHVDTLKQLLRTSPLLYSNPSYLAAHNLLDSAQLSALGLWLADYQLSLPPTPSGWPFIAFWQHTNKLRVPGISTLCDGDYFNGPLERLPLYGKAA